MLAKTKLSVCDHCGNVFQNGDRVWTDGQGIYCSLNCATYAQMARIKSKSKMATASAANDTIDVKKSQIKECPKMDEIKLTINGKEVQLTDEQLWALGFEPDNTKHSPFARVQRGADYFVARDHYAGQCVEANDATDNQYFDDANYFADENFARRVALHQLLNRKLLRFAWEHDQIRFAEDIDDNNSKTFPWVVRYSFVQKCFNSWSTVSPSPLEVLFKTEDAVDAAIEEVVKPFIKEHPEAFKGFI